MERSFFWHVLACRICPLSSHNRACVCMVLLRLSMSQAKSRAKASTKAAGSRCEACDVVYMRYVIIAICVAVRHARHAYDVRYGCDVRACTLCTLWTSFAVFMLCARCTLCTIQQARASNVVRRTQASVVALARLRQLSTCKDIHVDGSIRVHI